MTYCEATCDIEGVLAEALDGKARDTGLPHSRWPAQQGGFSGVAVGERPERTREVTHFGLSVDDIPRNELGTEHAGICDHR